MTGVLRPSAAVLVTPSDTALAVTIKELLARGDKAEARERYAELVSRHQQRASRIAYHYLRDVAEADEAVQDAFVRAFVHLDSFRDELRFEVWFTRILVNGCLDRIKARTRRERWTTRLLDISPSERAAAEHAASTSPSPEEALLARERRERLSAAVARLPKRQRTALILCHFDAQSPREAGAIMGLNEATVRVHLFRAIRKLRKMLDIHVQQTSPR